MKTLFFAAAVLAFTAAANLSSAAAAGPRASSGNTIPQTAYGATAGTTGTPHYEWQYSYVGHHPRYAGHWVLVQ